MGTLVLWRSVWGIDVTDPSGRYGEAEFQAIEAALSHTDQGRWFLSEYLARNTSLETQRLLDALHRLGANLDDVHAAPAIDQLGAVMADIDAALREALDCIGEGRSEGTHAGPQQRSEAAIETILEAVEDVQSFVRSVQTRNVHARLGEKIEARLRAIVDACANVESGGAQAARVAGMLEELRQRLNGVSDHVRPNELTRRRQFPESLLRELAQALS